MTQPKNSDGAHASDPGLERVLLVDDGRFDLEFARDALLGAAHLRLAESGEDALTKLSEQPCDIVISDLTMPGISGLELLERVRRDHPGTDFILITADASVESAVQALRMGAADYLTKPVPPEHLRRIVEQTLARRRLLAENDWLRQALRTAEACQALAPCLESGEVYSVALDLLVSTLGRSQGAAVHRRSLPPVGETAIFRGFDEGLARRLSGSLVGDKPVDLTGFERVELLESGPLHEALGGDDLEVGTVLSVPIVGREHEGGVIWILEGGRPFEPPEIDHVRVIASHAQAALENAERYGHAKERAFVDDVTEVYNARYLMETAENEIRRAERYENPLSVLFLDLDRFKLVNDRHGHLVGSQTLRNLSRLLLQCVRQVDTLARYGGDEFTILLIDTPHREACTIAERIRRAVEGHVFEAGRGDHLRLTVSIGVSTYPEHGEAREGLLEVADKAMYRAKSLGRNQVCSAGDLD